MGEKSEERGEKKKKGTAYVLRGILGDKHSKKSTMGRKKKKV